jgi:hypothetical protein
VARLGNYVEFGSPSTATVAMNGSPFVAVPVCWPTWSNRRPCTSSMWFTRGAMSSMLSKSTRAGRLPQTGHPPRMCVLTSWIFPISSMALTLVPLPARSYPPSARVHVSETAQPHAHVRSRRAIERRALWMAEDAARELPDLHARVDDYAVPHAASQASCSMPARSSPGSARGARSAVS